MGRRAREAFAGDGRAAHEDVRRRSLSVEGDSVSIVNDDEGLDDLIQRRNAAFGDGPVYPNEPICLP